MMPEFCVEKKHEKMQYVFSSVKPALKWMSPLELFVVKSRVLAIFASFPWLKVLILKPKPRQPCPPRSQIILSGGGPRRSNAIEPVTIDVPDNEAGDQKWPY